MGKRTFEQPDNHPDRTKTKQIIADAIPPSNGSEYLLFCHPNLSKD
jgi:hypothetical protein